jgi:hypothetical protein
MEKLFNLVPATEHQTSGSQAQVMLQAYQERLLTGMVTISNQPQNKVVLFLVEGSVLNGYQFVSTGWERVEQADWKNSLGRGDCRMLKHTSSPPARRTSHPSLLARCRASSRNG